jgi:hypothetical protein
LRANATFRSCAATGNSRGSMKRDSPGLRPRARLVCQPAARLPAPADSGELRARRALREAFPLKPRAGGIFVTVCDGRVRPGGSARKQNEHESATRESNPIFSGKASQKTRGGAIRLITVKRTSRAAGGPGPATARRGGKREQRTPESRGSRFGRGATDFASPRAPGSPICRDRVKGIAQVFGGPGPATACGGGKREQTPRESLRRDFWAGSSAATSEYRQFAIVTQTRMLAADRAAIEIHEVRAADSCG